MNFSGCYPAGNYKDFDRIFEMAMSLIEDDELIESLAICTKELLSNIRDHSYKMDMSKPIWIDVDVLHDQVTVTLIDIGEPWTRDGYYDCPNAVEKMQKLADILALRGRGHLILTMLTNLSGLGSLEYRRGGRVRILRFTRRQE